MSKHDTPVPGPTDRSNSSCVVGGDHVGRAVVAQLAGHDTAVTHLDETPIPDPPPGVTTETVAGPTVEALSTVVSDDSGVAFVLGRKDSENLLAVQLLRTLCDTERIVVLVNDPNRVDAFAALGVETIDASRVLAAAVMERA